MADEASAPQEAGGRPKQGKKVIKNAHKLLTTCAVKLRELEKLFPRAEVVVPPTREGGRPEKVAILELLDRVVALSALPSSAHERVDNMTFDGEDAARIETLVAALSGPTGGAVLAGRVDISAAIALVALYNAVELADRQQQQIASQDERLKMLEAQVQASVYTTSTGRGGGPVPPDDSGRSGRALRLQELPPWTPDAVRQLLFQPGVFHELVREEAQKEICKWCVEAELCADPTEGDDGRGLFANFEARVQRQSEFLASKDIPPELMGIYAIACLFLGINLGEDDTEKTLRAKQLVLHMIALQSPTKAPQRSADVSRLCMSLAFLRHSKTDAIRITHAHGMTLHPSQSVKIKEQAVQYMMRSGCGELRGRMLLDLAGFWEIDNWNVLRYQKLLTGRHEASLRVSEEQAQEVDDRVNHMLNKELHMCKCTAKPASRCESHRCPCERHGELCGEKDGEPCECFCHAEAADPKKEGNTMRRWKEYLKEQHGGVVPDPRTAGYTHEMGSGLGKQKQYDAINGLVQVAGAIQSKCEGEAVVFSRAPEHYNRLRVQDVPPFAGAIQGCRDATAFVEVVKVQVEIAFLRMGDLEAAFDKHDTGEMKLSLLLDASPKAVDMKRLRVVQEAAVSFNVQPLKSLFDAQKVVKLGDVSTHDLVAVLKAMGSSITQKSLQNIVEVDDEVEGADVGDHELSSRADSTRNHVLRKILRVMGSSPDEAFTEAVANLWPNLGPQKTWQSAVEKHGEPINASLVRTNVSDKKLIKQTRRTLNLLLRQSGSSINEKKWFGRDAHSIMVSFVQCFEEVDDPEGSSRKAGEGDTSKAAPDSSPMTQRILPQTGHDLSSGKYDDVMQAFTNCAKAVGVEDTVFKESVERACHPFNVNGSRSTSKVAKPIKAWKVAFGDEEVAEEPEEGPQQGPQRIEEEEEEEEEEEKDEKEEEEEEDNDEEEKEEDEAKDYQDKDSDGCVERPFSQLFGHQGWCGSGGCGVEGHSREPTLEELVKAAAADDSEFDFDSCAKRCLEAKKLPPPSCVAAFFSPEKPFRMEKEKAEHESAAPLEELAWAILTRDEKVAKVREAEGDTPETDLIVFLCVDYQILKAFENAVALGKLGNTILVPATMHFLFAAYNTIAVRFWDTLHLQNAFCQSLNLHKPDSCKYLMQKAEKRLVMVADAMFKVADAWGAFVFHEFRRTDEGKKAFKDKPLAPGREREVKGDLAMGIKQTTTIGEVHALMAWLRDYDFDRNDQTRVMWCALEFIHAQTLMSNIMRGQANGCYNMIMANYFSLQPHIFSCNAHPNKLDEAVSFLTTYEMLNQREHAMLLRRCLSMPFLGHGELLPEGIAPDAKSRSGVGNNNYHELVVKCMKELDITSHRDAVQKAALLGINAQVVRATGIGKAKGDAHTRYREERPEFAAGVYAVYHDLHEASKHWAESGEWVPEPRSLVPPWMGTLRLMRMIKERTQSKRAEIKYAAKTLSTLHTYASLDAVAALKSEAAPTFALCKKDKFACESRGFCQQHADEQKEKEARKRERAEKREQEKEGKKVRKEEREQKKQRRQEHEQEQKDRREEQKRVKEREKQSKEEEKRKEKERKDEAKREQERLKEEDKRRKEEERRLKEEEKKRKGEKKRKEEEEEEAQQEEPKHTKSGREIKRKRPGDGFG